MTRAAEKSWRAILNKLVIETEEDLRQHPSLTQTTLRKAFESVYVQAVTDSAAVAEAYRLRAMSEGESKGEALLILCGGAGQIIRDEIRKLHPLTMLLRSVPEPEEEETV